MSSVRLAWAFEAVFGMKPGSVPSVGSIACRLCSSWPWLTNSRITVPAGTVERESTKRNASGSSAVTSTWAGPTGAGGDSTGGESTGGVGDSAGVVGDSAGGAVPPGVGAGTTEGATEEGTLVHGPLEPQRPTLLSLRGLVLARRFSLWWDCRRARVCGQR